MFIHLRVNESGRMRVLRPVYPRIAATVPRAGDVVSTEGRGYSVREDNRGIRADARERGADQ